ncbi:MAG TPA: ATP-binding cassette domain-containing protein [Nitrospirae bacterium]|nr:putative multidrug export ATP-binding/permease protein [bacterium BMS3Abin10]GBE39668.1 putative multidrug export ATP-binding/permease protein [bacterium BMS3Bbin08]HDH51149.1 ATP-binding cassette domain-containing protein [Nitrospirota bacterium]HDK41319.1 ATP-binding cassette domain-containing protein [Nitrospirota bacterium]HDK82293.1 ATP-binding cassette domain-containing protein [Nitrospirota bacterium]
MESYKRLSAYLRPYWWIIIIATLFSLVTSGLSGAIAWFVKPVLDGTLNKETGTIKIFLLVYISFLLLKSLSAFAGSYLMRAVGAKVVRDVREQLFNKLIYLPMNFFINKPSGDVISRVINDANVLQGVLGYVAKDILVEIPTFIALLAVAFIRGWDIALMACFVLPFSFYVIGRFGKKMKVIGRKTQEQISGLTVRLTESISGIKMIKAFVRQKLHLDKFDKENRKYYWIAMKGARTIEYSKLAQEIIGGIGLTLILFYGLNLIVSGRMSEGDLMSCFTALALMYTPVRRLGSANNSLQQARAAAERIFYMLDQEPEEDGTKELPVIRDNIEFSNFSFIYPGTDKKVIDNINLKVRKGELTAIVGKSGAGKTTLVDMIPRFYRPTEGKLLIDGTDINEATHKSLRINIGIVSQDVILFNESVRDNIALGKLDASDEEIADAAKAAYAHDFIKDMPKGYNTLIGERGVRLSGGQKQRISIARALLKNPPILILDEATSSLDTASELIVQKALDNLMTNRTTFVIAHRLSTIQKADRILVIDKGKIIETGTHEELLNKGGAYKVLYHSQFDRPR